MHFLLIFGKSGLLTWKPLHASYAPACLCHAQTVGCFTPIVCFRPRSPSNRIPSPINYQSCGLCQLSPVPIHEVSIRFIYLIFPSPRSSVIDSSVDFNCFNQQSFSSAVSQSLDSGSGDPVHDCAGTPAPRGWLSSVGRR